MSINEFYLTSIRSLPASERLRLASLILGELASHVGGDIDVKESWSDEDLADLTTFAASHANSLVDNEGNDA